jgi:hypothetical protein
MSDDLTKQKFDRWRVLGLAEKGSQRRRRWLCRCRCGTERPVLESNLVSGRSTSCGCKNKRHGGRERPEYYLWRGILRRCLNPDAKDYARYGGKGVTVCKRWRSFKRFFEDMGQRPGPGYTIDRKDGSKGYTPGNCRWATKKEQGRNKRNNHMLTFRGETRCLSEWAEVLGKSRSEINLRLRRGWSVDDALSRPSRDNGGKRFVPANGTEG